MDKKIKEIISQMTLEDKIKLCSGATFWESEKMEQYDIPSFFMSDGPHGLRTQKGRPIIWASITAKNLPVSRQPVPAVHPGIRSFWKKWAKSSERKLLPMVWMWFLALE